MPSVRAGQPWEGQEYNERLSPGLGPAMFRSLTVANAEAALHPGLYLDRTDDIVSPQLAFRGGLQLNDDQLAALGLDIYSSEAAADG